MGIEGGCEMSGLLLYLSLYWKANCLLQCMQGNFWVSLCAVDRWFFRLLRCLNVVVVVVVYQYTISSLVVQLGEIEAIFLSDFRITGKYRPFYANANANSLTRNYFFFRISGIRQTGYPAIETGYLAGYQKRQDIRCISS